MAPIGFSMTTLRALLPLLGILLLGALFPAHGAFFRWQTQAAYLSGVPVRATLCLAYALSGLFAAVAGICQAAQETQGDPGAHGAYLAAKAVGREKEMKFVGIDALPREGVQYVRDGWLDVTFAHSACAREAIDTALALRDKREVPREIVVGTRRYDAGNVAQGGVAVDR